MQLGNCLSQGDIPWMKSEVNLREGAGGQTGQGVFGRAQRAFPDGTEGSRGVVAWRGSPRPSPSDRACRMDSLPGAERSVVRGSSRSDSRLQPTTCVLALASAFVMSLVNAERYPSGSSAGSCRRSATALSSCRGVREEAKPFIGARRTWAHFVVVPRPPTRGVALARAAARQVAVRT